MSRYGNHRYDAPRGPPEGGTPLRVREWAMPASPRGSAVPARLAPEAVEDLLQDGIGWRSALESRSVVRAVLQEQLRLRIIQ